MQSMIRVLLALWYLSSLVTSRATCNKARSINETSVASATDDSDDGDDSYANAMQTCDEAVNCEVYYDADWPGYLARFKPGMEPGSAWYEENVAPFDDYLQTPNKTDDEYERHFDEDMTKMENDEDAEETSSNSMNVMRRQSSQDDSNDERKKKKRNIYFNLTRKKRNTHYGHLKPTTVLKKAEKLCTTTQCSGHHIWKDIRSQKGGDVVLGNLILQVHGFFSPKPGHSGQKFHFIKAAAHTAWKTSHSHHGHDYQDCTIPPCGTSVCPPPICESKHLPRQHRSGQHFALDRHVRGKGNQWAMSGLFVAKVRMRYKNEEVCGTILDDLGLALGTVPGAGAYFGGFFGVLKQFAC